jgi:hypothetical protein
VKLLKMQELILKQRVTYIHSKEQRRPLSREGGFFVERDILEILWRLLLYRPVFGKR